MSRVGEQKTEGMVKVYGSTSWGWVGIRDESLRLVAACPDQKTAEDVVSRMNGDRTSEVRKMYEREFDASSGQLEDENIEEDDGSPLHNEFGPIEGL